VKERRLLYVFLGLLILQWSGMIAWAFWSNEWDWRFLAENAISSINFSAFIMTIFFVGKFRKLGVYPFRKLLWIIFGISIVCSFGVTFLFMLDATTVIDIELFDEVFSLGMLAIIAIVLFLVFLLVFVLILGLSTLILMGFVGVLYLFMVGLVPLDLRWVKLITLRGHFKARLLAWVLLIPEHLDTGTLTVKMPERETEFPWKRFWYTMAWMVAFNALVAVYVSLNPFFLRSASLEELISLMTSGFIIVPIVVFPWLITERLDARIEGPVKDFRLYEGIRSRLIRTFLALGTLMIFIRFAVEDIALERIILNFGGYLLFSFFLLFAITFVYFNFFEYELVTKIIERLPWMNVEQDSEVPPDEAQVDDEEEAGPE
jgi:hypothetical protein